MDFSDIFKLAIHEVKLNDGSLVIWLLNLFNMVLYNEEYIKETMNNTGKILRTV